jgi:hypothetical protein
MPCFALHYITLHYITLHCITLHYITLHYITLHYITLHYMLHSKEMWKPHSGGSEKLIWNALLHQVLAFTGVLGKRVYYASVALGGTSLNETAATQSYCYQQ